jgi:hypothetical protein
MIGELHAGADKWGVKFMSSFSRWLVVAALPALGACATLPGVEKPAAAAASDVYAGTNVLDGAIKAAGGEAALRQVKELAWTGSATVNAGGKTTEIEMDTIVRPFTFARSTSWPKADGPKAARTIQAEGGQAWSVSRVSWMPLPEAEAAHELQQFALYGVMTLVSLKDAGVKVTETAPGKDGTRNLHVEHPKAPPMDLRFDASGKLVRIADSVRDPKGGAALIPQVVTLSGEMTSNGVKWPKRISIRQNDAPYFDMELATFEARPAFSNKPIPHTLEDTRPSGADAG